ncbi:MAG: phosphoglycerate kinase [Candidatus Schekmanbacteria bacterium RBG_13_48_7]|uniref:Phosphoglycerate kinase n=1 Tax=Candidatus Schekmanbacteria bacterium RBG_13_48_7 TaxID=1817878 RepID=A0A1F7RNQ6_9BACT|nr:MAG: phosphoglycerate kinase [Candidatus Schekmanbacteria bacterium RBG_13_48_7]
MLEKMTSIDQLELTGKRVFIRVDVNVPLDNDQNITDDSRIKAVFPTIKKAINSGAKVILASHLGRPSGIYKPEYSLKPVALRLSKLLEHPVVMAPDCIGEEVHRIVDNMKPGDIVILENLRFHAGERDNDPVFADQLASLTDVYIDDAFGTAHRAHASIVGIAERVKEKGYGYLMEKEIRYLGDALADPEKPFLAILGGIKVSDKIGVIQNFFRKVDCLIIGGAMAYTFLKATGHKIGKSFVENDKLDLAKSMVKEAKAKSIELLLPIDHVVAPDLNRSSEAKTVLTKNFPDDMMGLDIGEQSIKLFKNLIKDSKTILWNGPLGAFETAPFDKGTNAVLESITDSGALTIVSGGDVVAAVRKFPSRSKITHISTGGGACLEFLEGKILPGVKVLFRN